MKPEPGSIEANHPGVVRRLMRVRENIFYMNRGQAGDPALRLRMHRYLAGQLNQLALDTGDARASDLIANSIAWLERNSIHYADESFDSFFKRTCATLWELTVACTFAGDHIYLNQSISELYPDEFRAVQARLPKQTKIDREIDLAILDHDGSWRWIEVKDWGGLANGNRQLLRKILEQSRGQNIIRRALKMDIKLVLLLKYTMSEEDYLNLRLNSRHDEIRFVFLEPGK